MSKCRTGWLNYSARHIMSRILDFSAANDAVFMGS